MALSIGAWYLHLTFMAPHPAAAQLAGASIELAALVLFRSSIRASRHAGLHPVFDTCTSRMVVSSGPYRYARHPFYLSYILFWSGWSIAIWNVGALAPLAFVTIVYVAAARLEEKGLAATCHAREYRDYMRRAGFFWPRLRGFPDRS
jgi:protein-S-isoprenylcysteine O-methyltransferase Ste14